MFSELNYQFPVTDVAYHPRDHMMALCALGDNQPILIYNYDPKGNSSLLMMTFLAFYAIRNSEMYIKGIFYIVRSVKDISFVLELSSVFFIRNLFFH